MADTTNSVSTRRVSRRLPYLKAFVISFLLLIIGLLLSTTIGAVEGINAKVFFLSLVQYDGSIEHLIMRTLRMPRAALGALVGANLAIAGLLMQGISRNPLASPGIFGVNAGASLFVALAFTGVYGAAATDASSITLPFVGPLGIVPVAFLGAAFGGVLVYFLGGVASGRVNPVRLVLAGVAVSTLLASLMKGAIILRDDQTDSIVFWLAGAVDGSDWNDVQTILPWTIVGLGTTVYLAVSLNLLALGEDVAVGLGRNIHIIRAIGGVGIICVAGSAVAVAGPITFVGLIVPHICRRLIGVDHRVLLALAPLLGATMMVYSDILARFIAYPFESPAGIVTALVGGPYFLYLTQRTRID